MADVPIIGIVNGVPTTGTGEVATLIPVRDVLGAAADAASATTTIKAALRAIATALGSTALDLGAGTGGTRTLRTIIDSSQFAALGQATMAGSQPVVIASDQSVIPVAGTVAHDAVDLGNPIKVGNKAIAYGTNPTAVAAGDRTDAYANRAGIPFQLGGHPNIISRAHAVLDSDGAQTDAALVTIASGLKIAITQFSVKMDAANSGNTAVRIGFGATVVPAASLAGTNGIVVAGNFAANGGHQKGGGAGVIAVGADGEDLRLTCGDPAGGAIYIEYSYFTIES